MNKPFGAGQSLALLDQVRVLVSQFRDRTAKINDTYRSRVAKERKTREAALAEQAAQFATALSAEEANYQAARAATETKCEARKALIGKAYQASKEQVLSRIDLQIGGRKYELQKKTLQAERDRDAGLTAAAHALQEFKTQLTQEQEALAALEQAGLKAFSGYGAFGRLLANAYAQAQPDSCRDEHELLARLRARLTKVGGDLARFRKSLLLGVFRYIGLWIGLAAALVAAVPVLQHAGQRAFTYPLAAGIAVAIVVVAWSLRFLGQRQAQPLAAAIAESLGAARSLSDRCREQSEAHHQQEVQRITDEFQSTNQASDQLLKQAMARASEQRVSCRMQNDEKAVRAGATNERTYRAKLERLEQRHAQAVRHLRQSGETSRAQISAAATERENKLTQEYQAEWDQLEREWKAGLQTFYAQIEASNSAAQALFPPWENADWKHWKPRDAFSGAARFARLEVEVERLCDGLPKDARLALPGPARFPLALSLTYPEQGSLLLETGETGHDEAIGTLNNVILRLLATAPPGRLNFTILDPVGLGQNFAGVMHLADYEEQIINSRIWTQSGQMDQRLADLNEHMEKVIQMYLRNEYQTIAEYNEQAGVIAEKYYFLVVADFPANFTETAAKRLLSIAASGARCGVYTLIHWDHRLPLPQEFIADDLRRSSFCVSVKGRDFLVAGQNTPGLTLLLDPPPPPDLATEFIHQVGRASRDSSRVEVPFAHVAPPDAEVWSEETTGELRVPIGRTGATKLQYLAIGKGTRQHGLLAGKTGSGKSTLFHVIITNLSLWCSPEQVEFYLVDFKKGVEFKCYAANRLPHARVVAIESDREFGLSVLQRVDDELKRRGDLFRHLGVQDIPGYKRAGGTEHIPRSLLLIDEFQEFFVEDDKISQTASLLLDRIVRQGRAFGIHVLLGSQTLGGAYTVARTTLGQMVIRIALQCNEADAYLIMDDNNPAPRLLSRPGEGIYNDTAGTIEGNSPFQVVWLPDEVRETYLAKVRARADQQPGQYPGPIVFEGNAPSDIRENPLFRALLEAESIKSTRAPRIWLGAPNSIKGPTEVTFYRQSGNNLLMVGQREESVLAMLASSLIGLAAQHPLGAARFILCDSTPPGSPQRAFLERVIQLIPHPVTLAKQGDLADIMGGLATDLKARGEQTDAEAGPVTFLFINGLQRFGKLRHEEDFGFSSSDADSAPNPAAVLNSLICEGARLGFHVVATCDTYNNVNRFLSRKALSEFEMRVLFQMSANDSASLIDSPKASTLGLHRALYYNEHEGYLETFRPYALPGSDWLDYAGRQLTGLLKVQV